MEDKINDFIIVLLSKQDKERLMGYCELKQKPLYEFCQQAIVERLDIEVKS